MTDEEVDSKTEDSMPNSGPEILPEDQLAEGDCLFHASLPPEVESVWAMQTTSQQLAEKHQWNLEKTRKIPDYLREFEDVFSKKSFDALLEQKVWENAIELEPGSKPSNCKVYPLSPKEQDELDAFLQENLQTGHIWPSKSPMASPVFLIKKKDGVLQLFELLGPECHDHEELIPYTSHLQAHKPTPRCQVLHQARCLVGVQQYAHL